MVQKYIRHAHRDASSGTLWGVVYSILNPMRPVVESIVCAAALLFAGIPAFAALPRPITTPADSPAVAAPGLSAADTAIAGVRARDSAGDTAAKRNAVPTDSGPAASRHAADTFRADSLRAAALRDSLDSIKTASWRRYRDFPQTVDSIFAPWVVRQPQLFQSNASGMSERLRSAPLMIAAPFSLSSSMNRALYCGYPMPASGPDYPAPGNRRGTDLAGITEYRSLSMDAASGMSAIYEPRGLPAPELLFLWETGVFSENILNVRFARPLSQHLQLAVASSFRYFSGTLFDHGSGDVYNFYRTMISDTSLIANIGRNPLVNEQNAGIRLAYSGSRWQQLYAAYRYSDTRNDLQNVFADTAGGWPQLRWERLTQYDNILEAGIERCGIAGPLFLDLNAGLDRNIHATAPLSLRLVADEGPRRGTDDRYRVGVRPGAGWASDTAWLEYLGIAVDRRMYDTVRWTSGFHQGSAGWEHAWSAFSARGSAGAALMTRGDSMEYAWQGSARVRGTLFGQDADLYLQRAASPYDPPSDPRERIPGPLLDTYWSAQVTLFLHARRLGLLLGYSMMQGIDSSTIMHSWPHGLPPYAAPGRVILLAPMIGRFGGCALMYRCFISDARPYIKSQTQFSYDARLRDGREHVLFDLLADYWSARDRRSVGDPRLWLRWERPVIDVSFKTSVQIQEFSLFLKADNLLNRSYAWVPGYVMPGLTFRWGFEWFIGG
jgi:hypothetical protein